MITKELEKWKKQNSKSDEKQSFYSYLAQLLAQLYDGNYTDWDSFVAKFNDNAWKENEKNKPFIEKLADLLKCSFDEVNAKKIEKLSEKIESNVQKLLSEKQEAL